MLGVVTVVIKVRRFKRRRTRLIDRLPQKEQPALFERRAIRASYFPESDIPVEEFVDLNEELIPNPVSTFFGKVRGISLIDDDIEDSDSVIVDRMLEPRWGDLAVCVTSEGFTMKYVEVHDDGEIWLMPGNRDYAPIRITGENKRLIWGIVTHSIRQLRRLQAAVDEVNGPLNLDSRLVVLGAELTGQNNTRLRREMLSKCPSTKWSDRIDIAV